MAISKGFFSKRRGSAGSLTFSVLNGKQVTKEKVASMTNPKSDGQSVQRLKLAPAQKFYSAFENVLNHSWQSSEYGNKSRNYFMSKALARNGGPYVIKGSNILVPGTYPVSEGTLGTIRIQQADGDYYESSIKCASGDSRASIINSILSKNAWIPLGAKLTVLTICRAAGDEDLNFYTLTAQIVLDPNYEGEDDFNGLFREILFPPTDPIQEEYDIYPSLIAGAASETWGECLGCGTLTYNEDIEISGCAFIVSEGDRASDRRSNSWMAVTKFVQDNFYSENAYLMAIYSYQRGGAVSVGDEWYLNTLQSGEIGRVVARALRVNNQTVYYLVLVVLVAGQREEYILTKGKFDWLIDTNGNPASYYIGTERVILGLDNIDPDAPHIPFTSALLALYNGVGAAQSSQASPSDAQHAPSRLADYPAVFADILQDQAPLAFSPEGNLITLPSEDAPGKYLVHPETGNDGYAYKCHTNSSGIIEVEKNYDYAAEFNKLGYLFYNLGSVLDSNVDADDVNFNAVKRPVQIVELAEKAGITLDPIALENEDYQVVGAMVNENQCVIGLLDKTPSNNPAYYVFLSQEPEPQPFDDLHIGDKCWAVSDNVKSSVTVDTTIMQRIETAIGDQPTLLRAPRVIAPEDMEWFNMFAVDIKQY